MLQTIFGFRGEGTLPPLVAGQPSLPDLPTSKADPNGAVSPFATHIRKVNTRDDPIDQG